MSERAADRLFAGVEHHRDLFGPEAEDVAQDQDRPLPGWQQQLQGSHERQGDGLACLDAGIGARCGVRDSRQERIGVGLQLTPVPLDQLGERIRVAGLRPGDKISVDGNPPIPVRLHFRLSCYWYRRRGDPESGTPGPGKRAGLRCRP
jgi:hypothetical protein